MIDFMATSFTYANMRWSLLSRVSLDEVAQALDHPALREWICAEHISTFYEALLKRVSDELEGKGMTFVIRRKGKIVGITGLSEYPGVYGALQTSTYLHPDYWGTGVNAYAKSFLWTLANDLLGHDFVVSSVAMANTRSQAAMNKTQEGIQSREVFEYWRPRQAMLFRFDSSPKRFKAMTGKQQELLRERLVGAPAWRRWVHDWPWNIEIPMPTEVPEEEVRELMEQVDGYLLEQGERVEELVERVAGLDEDEDEAKLHKIVEQIEKITDQARERADEAVDHLVEQGEVDASILED